METPGQPPVMLEIPQELDPIRSTVETFISALIDNHSSRIGVFGAGGIGKTRIASQIGEKVRREKLFEAVMTVRVGRSVDPEATIAYAIYDHFLGRFKGGDAVAQTTELLSKLFTQKRVLIILDDVCEFIDLQRAGIPQGPCKILIMSRSEKVCLQMQCKMIFKLQIKDDASSSSTGSASMSSALMHPSIQSIISNIFDSLKEVVVGDISALSKESVNSIFKGRKNPLVLDHVWSIKALMMWPFQRWRKKILFSIRNIISNLLDLSKEGEAEYLIVLDDVWSTKAWHDVKKIMFPDHGDGSRTVITTSRLADAGSLSPLHEMHRVNLDQRWVLVKQKVFPNTDCPSDLENIGRDIARRCRGLPLAIRLVAGIASGNELNLLHNLTILPHDLDETINAIPPLKMQESQYEDSSNSSFLNVEKAGVVGNRGEIEEVRNEAKSEEYKNNNKKYLNDFILFCSVLPLNYEFTKDVLVWQWIAGGLIELGEDKRMEEVCGECFDTLVDMHYFVPSHYDHVFHQMKYKIGDEMTIFLQTQPLKPKFGKYLDCKMSCAAEVEHMSVTLKNIDHMELGVFKEYGRLQTLVSYDGYGLDHLPSYIFLGLKNLKILNLSGTNVAVLPSSIENLRELRFFDMSKTPIRWLPETIRYFSHLETLKVDGCLQLRRLPKCMDKLISLQHLILDVRRLQSMPVGIGKLSNLRTLNAFLVGEGCVGELKDLNKLRGSFCLLNLENVGSKEEAVEARLHNKVDLRKIELHWSDVQDEKSPSEEEILGSLRPPTSIQELGILFYSGEVLPSWICSREFSELQSINLYGCKYCSSLPSLGELPSLKSLSINENNEVVEIDSSFFRKQTNQSRVAFPKLENLSIYSMSKLEKWTGFENGDFPSLRNLIIEYCPRFVGLGFLSHLNSLSRLEIRYCPELSCLPEDGLPPSLESLMIKQSPKLKAQCCDEQWEDWSKVARVPSIYIDDQEFSPKFSINIQEIRVERDEALETLS